MTGCMLSPEQNHTAKPNCMLSVNHLYYLASLNQLKYIHLYQHKFILVKSLLVHYRAVELRRTRNHHNELMMHLYSALLCIAVHPKH